MSKTILTIKQLRLIIKMIKSKSDYVCYVNNPYLGMVYLPYGTYGDISNPIKSKGGYGFEHIIQKRYEVDKLNVDELSNLIILTLEKVKTNMPKRAISNERYIISSSGIELIIQKSFVDGNNKWIITSYPKYKKGTYKIKKEARDSIRSVNERYRYCPEFSYFRTQVGALTSTIDIVREAFNKVKNKKRSYGYYTNGKR